MKCGSLKSRTCTRVTAIIYVSSRGLEACGASIRNYKVEFRIPYTILAANLKDGGRGIEPLTGTTPQYELISLIGKQNALKFTQTDYHMCPNLNGSHSAPVR